MRNLKKILALVLALVMTMSLVTVASATEEVSANYEEAVTVLSDMGVFKGYEDGSFGGKNLITREEVATILYRIISKDVDDSHKGLYVEACTFADVANTRWSAGFIGYCANGGYVKGYDAKTFAPSDKVTGYQVLAMILRAIGYDKNGEFTGSEWTKNVAATAQQLGVLQNVSKDVVLSQPATRELVAELIFRTIATVPQVTYTPAFGYQPILNNVNKADVTLGYANFELYEHERETKDEFGRPGYSWTYNVYPYETVLMDDPYEVFNTAATECEISIARGNRGTWNAIIWVNGTPVGGEGTETYFAIQAADQVAKLGAQGRIMEVYADRLVMIDTFLAKVEATTPVVKDTAGHVIKNATMTLTVYDGVNETTTNTVTRGWDWEYAVGDYVLVNGLTAEPTAADITTTPNVDNYKDVLAMYYWHVLGVAESFVGKQSALHYNIEKHTIDGVTYDDANAYELNKAGNVINTFNWFKDQFGNIIGSTIIPTTYQYGVINSIQWFTQAGSVGYAQANVTLIDGTTKTVVVSALYDEDDATVAEASLIRGYTTKGDITLVPKTVSTEYIQNNDYVGYDMYRIYDNGNGTFTLVDVANPIVTEGAEKTGVTVSKGNAVMISNTAVVDSNTKFLFGYNYGNVLGFATVTYTGFNTIATLLDATVDYVDLNGDKRVDLAYVYGTSPSAQPYASLFYMTTNSYVQQLYNENGIVNAYVLSGYVNGVEGTIKIANDDAGTQLVNDILAAWNANDKNVLLQVDVVAGHVVSQKAVTTTAAALTTVYGYSFPSKYVYYGDSAVRYDGAYTTATYNGDVMIMSNGTVYDVTETTQIYGELNIGVAYGANYVIHVVYDSASADKDALEIYVFAKPLVGGTTGGTTTGGFTGINATLVPGGVLTVTNYAAGVATAVAANANYTVTYYVNGVQQATVTGIIVAGNASSVITLPGANVGTVIAVITCNGYTTTVVL